MPVKKSNPDKRPLTRTRRWTKVIHDPIPELGRHLQRYYRKDDPTTGDYFVSLYLPEDGTVVSTEKVSGSDTEESHIFDGDYKFATEMASISPRRRRATAPEGLARTDAAAVAVAGRVADRVAAAEEAEAETRRRAQAAIDQLSGGGYKNKKRTKKRKSTKRKSTKRKSTKKKSTKRKSRKRLKTRKR